MHGADAGQGSHVEEDVEEEGDNQDPVVVQY